MPRGGGASAGRGAKKNYKGKRRVFTSAEEIQRQNEQEQKQREWREKHGDDEEGEQAEDGGARGDKDSSDSESSSEEEEQVKNKGVSHLIEIQNPNRAIQKTKKASDLDQTKKTQLTRREREEIEKQQAQVKYQEMHMQGKTEEAMSDLARLSIIRKQREEAARKREEEKKAKEAAAAESASKKGKS